MCSVPLVHTLCLADCLLTLFALCLQTNLTPPGNTRGSVPASLQPTLSQRITDTVQPQSQQSVSRSLMPQRNPSNSNPLIPLNTNHSSERRRNGLQHNTPPPISQHQHNPLHPKSDHLSDHLSADAESIVSPSESSRDCGDGRRGNPLSNGRMGHNSPSRAERKGSGRLDKLQNSNNAAAKQKQPVHVQPAIANVGDLFDFPANEDSRCAFANALGFCSHWRAGQGFHCTHKSSQKLNA